jgi:type II secretory pathway pseudopilin PulG
MQEFLKVVCIIVLAVCAGVMIYSFASAIHTSKKNKQTDEATRKIFMAQMAQNTKNLANSEPSNSMFKQPTITITPSRPTQLDYDKFEQDEETVDTSKSITDFFKKM